MATEGYLKMSDKIRILYIDDYELDRELVKDALEKEHGGFEVMEAADKPEFEALLKTQEFDLVLSDFNIAGFEGLQVLEAVRAYDPRLPVIIVTGTGSEEIAVMALKQGVSDYVIKRPKHIQRLPQTIFAAIEKQKLQDQHQDAEISLKESEERFRAISMNTPDHILIQDKDLRYVWVLNPQLGLTEEDMVGKTDFDFLSKEDATALTKIKKRILATGKKEFLKVPLVSRNGETQYFEGSYIPKHDHGGKIDGLIGYFRNVTDRVKSEQALKDSEKKYRTILENVLVGVYQVSLDGKFLFANKKMTEMFGYSSPDELEAIGSIAELYARPEERDNVVEKVLGKGFVHDEYEFRRKDGQHIWVRLHIRKTEKKEGKIILEGLIEDISELKKMEIQLQQTQRLESIGTLAGGIAHDFNNILSAVIGFTELSIDDVEPGTLLHNNLTEVLLAGKRAKDLVKQIMTFSRKGEQEKKPIQLNPLVLEAVRMLRSMIPTNIEIKEQVSNEMLMINANPSQINQVILNLVTNASHAIKENGIIEIGLQEIILDENIISQYPDLLPGKYAEIFVSDNGCGITKENLNVVFDPYFTTKDPDKGTGLGLAVVHGIVKIHSGHITVFSEVGKGTTFHVYLPLYRQQSLLLKSTPQSELLTGGTERILLVDDEPSIVKMQKLMIQRLGYTVATQNSSMEALESFRADPGSFDLIITDMTMPGMTGDRLAAEVKKIRPDIPVILCTGFSEKVNLKTAKDIMIDGFLMKPVDKEKMVKMIRNVLDEAKKKD